MLRDVLFNCVVICIKVSNRSTSWNQFPGTNWKGCLFRSVCFFFNMLIYFVISYIVFRVSVADLKRLKINMKIKIRCFKVLLWQKKIITPPLKFVVYKFERSAAPLMGSWICTTSDRTERWTFRKFYSRGSAWS